LTVSPRKRDVLSLAGRKPWVGVAAQVARAPPTWSCSCAAIRRYARPCRAREHAPRAARRLLLSTDDEPLGENTMRKILLSIAMAAMTFTFAAPALADKQQKPTGHAAQTKQMAAPKDDHAFAMHMAQHHRDGIAMADAVITNGKSDSVKSIARRIKADQQKDLVKLEGHKGRQGHASSAMAMPKDPDMERSMAALKAAKGAEADRLFLELMIAHHAEGLMTAHTAMPELDDSELKSIATSMFAKQAREIGELQRLREGNRAARRKP
jgi:uncharacterized protein (DUF305 family)